MFPFPGRQILRIREILMTASTGLLSAVASAGAKLFAFVQASSKLELV